MNRRSIISLGAAAVLSIGIAFAIATLVTSSEAKPIYVVFRTLAPSDAHGRIAIQSAGAPDASRKITSMSCARVHYAGGAGVCLVEEPADRSVLHIAYTFDHTFTRQHRIVLSGIPVRVRVAPDGRRAAITIYGEEETPAGERLATESIIIDLKSGQVLGDLREFSIDTDGAIRLAGPIDFASVTFQDGDRFYVSLSNGDQQYLSAGSVNERRMRLVRPGIVNEAISPDGKRLIAKKRSGERGYWQLTVIDLETWAERPLNQGPRSVDDQVEWLDEGHVLYHDVTDAGTGIWKLSIDGVAGPELLIANAISPAVRR